SGAAEKLNRIAAPARASRRHLSKLLCRVTEQGGDPPALPVGVEERRSHNSVLTRPSHREGGLGVFDMDWLRVPIARQANGEVLGRIEHPGIAGFAREQHKLTPMPTMRLSCAAARC